MKELNEELKGKVVEGLKKVKPELSEEEIKEKINNLEFKKVNDEELANVSGGGILTRPPIDENKVINGWTYTALRDILLWMGSCYEKDIVKGFAENEIPSRLWENFYHGYPYPAYILEPMWRIWCPNELGF